MLLKSSFLFPHLFCNAEFELIQLISEHEQSSEILIFQTEIRLEFQNEMNIDIMEF